VAPTIGRLDALQGIHGPYQWPLLFAAGIDPARVGSPAHAATFSDGVAETQLPSATIRLTEDIFVAYALVGTTLSVAAGDNGSQSFPGVPGLPQSYPASSPWVVAIGGTNTSLDRANQITEELVWNDTRYQGSDPEATGGGPSEVFEAPPWNPGSARRLPDVSFFAAAYPGTAQVVDFGLGLQWYGAAGTSFASPLFATAVALVDARLEAVSRPRLGLVTPWLYQSASALWSSGALRDITVGSNDLADVGCCTAAVGYDMASGLGSIRFDLLLEAALGIGVVPAEPVALVPAFTG
jgi:subtilase family serine protease